MRKAVHTTAAFNINEAVDGLLTEAILFVVWSGRRARGIRMYS